MAELLTRETALRRVVQCKARNELFVPLLLILQAEALEIAAEKYVRPVAVMLDDGAYTGRGLHSPEASCVMDAISEMWSEAARLRREAR